MFPALTAPAPLARNMDRKPNSQTELGSEEDPNRAKATPEGQVRVPFLEETAAGKVVTLALATDFPRAVLSQELHSAGPSSENTLQRIFPLIVSPETHGG
uniref:Uncharacterized protein n=1 Tax=Sciurus vulgaris TaxID=55149 RepID=A0A8D2CV71_SCIVU